MLPIIETYGRVIHKCQVSIDWSLFIHVKDSAEIENSPKCNIFVQVNFCLYLSHFSSESGKIGHPNKLATFKNITKHRTRVKNIQKSQKAFLVLFLWKKKIKQQISDTTTKAYSDLPGIIDNKQKKRFLFCHFVDLFFVIVVVVINLVQTIKLKCSSIAVHSLYNENKRIREERRNSTRSPNILPKFYS